MFRQLLANIFSPQKRREIILKNVIKERIYTSEIDNFTLTDIQELENHLKTKIKALKAEPQMRKFLTWVRKQNPQKRITVHRPK